MTPEQLEQLFDELNEQLKAKTHSFSKPDVIIEDDCKQKRHRLRSLEEAGRLIRNIK